MSRTTCAAPLASIDAITSAMRSYRAGFSFSVFCGVTFTKSTCLRGFTSSATLSTITTNRSSRSDTPSHWAHSGNEESEPRSLRMCGQRILQPPGAQPFVVPAQRRTEIEGQIVRQRFHQDARSREREGEPLPGDGVDVSGGVPDEREPLRPPRARSLQQGSGPAQVGVDACAGEPLAQSG